MKYRELNLSVKREAADIVCAMLYDYPIQGVEIEDEYITGQEQEAMFVDAMEVDNEKSDEVAYASIYPMRKTLQGY